MNYSKHKKVIENKDDKVKDTERVITGRDSKVKGTEKVIKDRDNKVKDTEKPIVSEKTEHDQEVCIVDGGKSKLVDYRSSEENLTGKTKEPTLNYRFLVNRKREREEQKKSNTNKKTDVTENNNDINQQYIHSCVRSISHKISAQGVQAMEWWPWCQEIRKNIDK